MTEEQPESVVRRKPNPNSESVDNYLKAILTLGGPDEERVTSKALADSLGVAPASVTNMLQKLAASADSLVEYELHRGVRLSPAGKKRALEVLRHHRLIETFLFEVLDYPLEEVHDEAERLEHFISERFEERIAARLGHPKFDPHGHCIPALDGKMPRQTSVPLSDLAGETSFLIESVADRDSPTLKLLRTSGIQPGVRGLIRSRSSTGSLQIRIGSSARLLDLPRRAAEAIRVRPLRKTAGSETDRSRRK
jgi:DtxR family Mn-dependent transcriptional regulator